jgi:hypothetical protein
MQITDMSKEKARQIFSTKRTMLSFPNIDGIWLTNLYYKKQWVIVPDDTMDGTVGASEGIKVKIFKNEIKDDYDTGTVYMERSVYNKYKPKLLQMIAILESRLGKIYFDGNCNEFYSIDDFLGEVL